MRLKPISMAITIIIASLISALLASRFYLMMYFPGTTGTHWIFSYFIPWWDRFSHITQLLQLPVKILFDLLHPFLPKEIYIWFPEMPASKLMMKLSKSAIADFNILYPGKVEWLTLLAIPIWQLLLISFHISIWQIIDNKDAIAQLEVPQIPLSLPKAESKLSSLFTLFRNSKPKRVLFKTETKPESTSLEHSPIEHSSPIYKERLSQFKPSAANSPKIYKYEDSTPESWESFKQMEGDMMVREMVRSLQQENRSLQNQQQELRSTFSQYFSPNVLKYLEDNKTAFQNIDNQKWDVSILFCDIRGFSTFSQSASSEEMISYLSEYFNIASYVILHRFDGVINKLMGDGLMAYWGFPIPVIDHAYIATQAALQILREVELRNQTTNQGNRLEIGIGIASGQAIVGNIGSTDFKDFTLLGVPVNLASRLDEANKELGTNLLISNNTYDALNDRITCHDYGKISLRNWQGVEHVYGPVIQSIL